MMELYNMRERTHWGFPKPFVETAECIIGAWKLVLWRLWHSLEAIGSTPLLLGFWGLLSFPIFLPS